MSSLGNMSSSGSYSDSEQLASTRLIEGSVSHINNDSIVLAKETKNLYGSVEQSSNRSTMTSSILTLDDYDQFPVYARCPTCSKTVLTRITYKIGTLTWIAFAVLLLCWCGCCLLPFFLSICKDVQHECPECTTVLGIYKRYKK